MTTPASTAPMPAAQSDLERPLGVSIALLGAMYLVVRPIANQFTPYSGEAAFCGLVAVLLALCVGLNVALGKRPLCAPDRLTLAALMWLGLFLSGMLRSPNLGTGVPLACDATIYVMLLLAGYFIARRDSALVAIFARVLVAMVAVEAFAAIWQRYVDLPRLWHEVRAGHENLPATLESAMGQARLYGDDVFGTFGNPNSLAAYLVLGIWLLVGLSWPLTRSLTAGRVHRALSVMLLLLMLFALYLTNSKGGYAACLAGAWFFAVQRVSLRSPKRGRVLAAFTWAGVAVLLVLLAAGMLGAYNGGRSLAVRFEYWRAAFRMIAERPLDGLGLGGFAESYSYFKTPLGTETREAHNDYIHLWTELGPLGPLLYLALWAMLLKAVRPAAPRQSVAEQPPADERAATLEKTALAGGVIGFVLMFCSFTVFNSADAVTLLSGTVNAQTIAGALHTLALPVIFAAVFLGLRTPALPGAFADGTAWVHGVRAAIGAILVHEVVDFDFRAQAVIGGLLLLAGMLVAVRETADGVELPDNAQRGALGHASRFVLPVLAVLLFPGAAWIPMVAGMPRAAAEALEEDARRMAREKPPEGQDPAKDKEYRELRREIAALRLKVAEAAPFDGNAWLDLAAAYEGMQRAHGSSSMRDQILACLAEAQRLRPLSAAPRLMFGDFHFQNALRASRRGVPISPDFKLAARAYAEAVARYPLAPGIRILLGDALLLDGQTGAAAQRYLEAFQTDVAIYDGNVRLSALFTDSRPGAAARHARDADILAHIATLPDSSTSAGFVLRRLTAAASLLNEERRDRKLPPELIRSLRTEMLTTGKALEALLQTPAERAHAALLHALSYELAGPNRAAAKAAAWDEATRLQAETVSHGAPGTAPTLFGYLVGQYGAAKPAPRP